MSYDSSQGTLKVLKRTYAERTRRTIFFLGAGASAEVGLPAWWDLRENLHKQLNEAVAAGADDQELENFRELEERRSTNDYWGYFAHAEDKWPTTYKDYLEAVFDIEIDRTATPVVYKRIWDMKWTSQVITLNVDGLLTRAFQESPRTKGNALLQYDGYSVTDSQAFFAKDAFCLLNLHGTLFQKSHWIMNERERRRLNQGRNGERYASFLTWIFQTHNIVFVGVNPRDIAVSPAIQLAARTHLLGKHFWICPSPQPEARKWAEENGVRLVAYTPQDGEDGSHIHSTDICSILDDLEKHVSEDVPIELPVSSQELDPANLETPQEIVAMLSTKREVAIKRMSGAATYVGIRHGFSGKVFDSLAKKYSLPIQIATSLDARTEPYNELGRYKLVNKIQGGGSSAVWLCEDIARPGNYLVAKTLSGNSHENQIERQSFRRGIESMFLLRDMNMPVAPKYIDHLELPLVVVMEHVAGSTMLDLIESNIIVESKELLKIFEIICRAVRKCHISQGHVLHRDLKPGNIIFKDWFIGYDAQDIFLAEVRLLNFDLSWHRYSSGNTKAISADHAGYYAPEQKGSKNSLPPRAASTDVYMLGMILFYILAKEHPPEGGARLNDWERIVTTHVKRRFFGSMLRNRVTRLIIAMTQEEMERRTDIEATLAEITNVLEFERHNYQAVDHDFLVENVLAAFGRDYDWDAGKLEGRVRTVPQAVFVVRYLPKGMRCQISFYRTRDDGDTRSSFGAKINKRIQNARQTLTDFGWECDVEGGALKSLKATIHVPDLARRDDLGTNGMDSIGTHLLASIE